MSDLALHAQSRSIADVVAEHIQAEIDLDLDKTMATMADNPHLTVFPTLAGAVGGYGGDRWSRRWQGNSRAHLLGSGVAVGANWSAGSVRPSNCAVECGKAPRSNPA